MFHTIFYATIPASWKAFIPAASDPGLCIGIETKLQCRSVLPLQTHVDDFVSTVFFGVVSLLFVNEILETPYI